MTPKQARLLAELTQSGMATLLGLHRATYIDKEQDPGRFTVMEANQFRAATGTTLIEVFGEKR